ncbi:hypothetical protein CAPTEDRAFT_198103 [Capitella teleta]|uniref:SUEL-type lectin domain-containing protein n=1 Tax=Capitella teleta TaxID=283909 RepID=X1ZYA5_CAPTE|nr:hypothetical protein CAPTEDRAFT_198103 [Capitella teleta]|eukprot:ELU04651.1 hypothetical protein CAPTEDRAFT_198103 [Capitella teleta]
METQMEAIIVQLCLVLVGINGVVAQGRTYQCFGKHFTKSLCAKKTILEIRGAEFAVSFCSSNPNSCCPQVNDDCKIDVEKSQPAYYSEILSKCNGRGACANLQASWTQANEECGQPNSDYVLIYYNCVSKWKSTPSTTKLLMASSPRIRSTISILSISTASDDPWPLNDTVVTTVDPGEGDKFIGVFNPLGIVIGVIAAAMMVVVPIVVGQILLMRKDKDDGDHVEAARGPDLNKDLYEFDDDETYDSWDEDWDENWESYPMEITQGEAGKQRKQSKRSRKSSKKSRTVGIAIVDPYMHSDDIYDVIDPRVVSVENPKADDVTLRAPKQMKSSIRDHNRTTPTLMVMNNSTYNRGHSKKMTAPPPPRPPAPPQAEVTPIYPVSDEIYLEPSMIESYYTELETAQQQLGEKTPAEDKHPNVLRQNNEPNSLESNILRNAAYIFLNESGQ